MEYYTILLVLFLAATVQAAPNSCSDQYQAALQQVLDVKERCDEVAYKDCCEASAAVKFSSAVLGSSPPSSGVYDINHVCGDKPHVFHTSIPTLQARCKNGGWMVILKRDASISPPVSFVRSWDEYKHGFGDLNSEFWYGLNNIHCLTIRQQVDLQILLHYTNGSKHVFTYKHFIVNGAENKFTLHVGQLQQPAPGGDGMAYHNGRRFSTYDKDNDASNTYNCAAHDSYGKGGGWWYGSCAHSRLTRPHPHIYWFSTGINYVEMKVRPKQCVLQ